MAPLPSPDANEPLEAAQQTWLLDAAERAILDGLDHRRPTLPDPEALPPELRRPIGSFVTLNVHGRLNGCIGSIETAKPLGVSVASHAWSAAFGDPRLPALRRSDYEHLDIEISVLSPLAETPADSRSRLIESLRPHVDGLLLVAGARRAVFLPSVWEQLQAADTFLARLFHKAGLDPQSWPSDLQAFVFTADEFGRRAR
jgi:AmmeMemoRadiSam system protein A